MNNRRRLARGAVVLVAVWGLVEGVSLIGVAVAPRLTGLHVRTSSDILSEQSRLISLIVADSSRIVVDSVLGWRYAFRDGTNGTLSSQALRTTRTYSPNAGPDHLRVAAFGDSFVFGSEVNVDETWPARAEVHDSTLEVLSSTTESAVMERIKPSCATERGAPS